MVLPQTCPQVEISLPGGKGNKIARVVGFPFGQSTFRLEETVGMSGDPPPPAAMLMCS